MAQRMGEINGPAIKTPAGRLRALLSRKDHITICPGVYDGLTARIALKQGFNCLYMVSQWSMLREARSH